MVKIAKLLNRIDWRARELQFNANVFSASGPRVRATKSIIEDVAEIQKLIVLAESLAKEKAERQKPVELPAVRRPTVFVKPAPPKPKSIERETPGFTGANAIPSSPAPPRSPAPTKSAKPTEIAKPKKIKFKF